MKGILRPPAFWLEETLSQISPLFSHWKCEVDAKCLELPDCTQHGYSNVTAHAKCGSGTRCTQCEMTAVLGHTLQSCNWHLHLSMVIGPTFDFRKIPSLLLKLLCTCWSFDQSIQNAWITADARSQNLLDTKDLRYLTQGDWYRKHVLWRQQALHWWEINSLTIVGPRVHNNGRLPVGLDKQRPNLF